jgi:hypothetical protein
MCVLTVDFQQAFYRISHQYLFNILQRYGISPWFVERIHALYERATASVQMNGSLAGSIPIRSGVRQGCPISVVLFALCLHPLIGALEDSLRSIKTGHTQHGPVIAYADDVTVFVTNPGDFHAIQQATHLHERATGARINPRKSKALAIGTWSEPPTALGINFHERVNILGVELGPTIATSIRDSWSVICAVRAQARRTYTRHLCLVQRMKYIQLYIFAKIWHVSQIFPLPLVQAQQLTTIFSWYLWQGGQPSGCHL